MATPSTQLISPLYAETWHQILSSSVGRDKVFRLIQYACKLIRGVQYGRAVPKDAEGSSVYALEGIISSSRQMWRLMKWISVYARPNSKMPALSLGNNLVKETCSLVSDTSLFLYLVLDNFSFIRKNNLVAVGQVGAATRRAAKFWFIAVFASAFSALHSLYESRRQRKRLVKGNSSASAGATTPEVAHIDRKIFLQALNLSKHLADAVVSASLASTNPLHPGLVGMFGSFSSAVGVFQNWPTRPITSTTTS